MMKLVYSSDFDPKIDHAICIFLNLLNSLPDFSVGNLEKPSGASVLFMHIY